MRWKLAWSKTILARIIAKKTYQTINTDGITLKGPRVHTQHNYGFHPTIPQHLRKPPYTPTIGLEILVRPGIPVRIRPACVSKKRGPFAEGRGRDSCNSSHARVLPVHSYCVEYPKHQPLPFLSSCTLFPFVYYKSEYTRKKNLGNTRYKTPMNKANWLWGL